MALIVEGSPPGAALFLLRKGAVEESREGVHTAFLGRGASFNSRALTQPNLLASSSFTTVKHCELFVLRRRDLFKVAQMYPKFAAVLALKV